jgi:hypothetical protein
MLGVLAPLVTGRATTALGYVGAGGTLDVAGLLFVNRSTWAHVVRAAARVVDADEAGWLDPRERAALDGGLNPTGIIVPPPR